MKTGEATCRVEHASEWAADRVNPCAVCFGIEFSRDGLSRTDLAHATVELDGDQS